MTAAQMWVMDLGTLNADGTAFLLTHLMVIVTSTMLLQQPLLRDQWN